jgi:hypothetical protein
MAEIHQGGTDSDVIAASMGVSNWRQYQILKKAMEKWDDNLKLQALNYQVGPNSIDTSLVSDVVTELSR